MMTVQDYIAQIDELNEDAVIYARRTDGLFHAHAEAVLLEVPEEHESLPTSEIAQLYCPGYDYFLEVFIIKEILEGFAGQEPEADFDRQVARVVHYAEYDA